MTIEDLYPACRPYLAVIRNPSATTTDKHKAAEWLLEQGLDQHPLAPKDEIISAYYGPARPPSLDS